MNATHARQSLLGIAVVCLATSAALAQDTPTPKVQLGGTYTITHLKLDTNTVSMDFTATITNNGSEDVAGPVVLRHPNEIDRVYNRFGDTTIRAGANATVNDVVTVPRKQWDEWAGSGGPSLFFYTKDERGDIQTVRIPLSEVKAPASKK
jgi:hypothetical protein